MDSDGWRQQSHGTTVRSAQRHSIIDSPSRSGKFMNWKSGQLMGRLFTLGIVLALILQQVLVAVPVAVAQTAGSAISVTDNSVADWAGVKTWFSDPVGDVSGTGQYDLIRLWLTNTAP